MVGRVNHPPDIPKSEGQKSHFKGLAQSHTRNVLAEKRNANKSLKTQIYILIMNSFRHINA